MSDSGRHIMLVDDSGLFEKYIQESLSTFHVETARTIQDAYWLYVKQPELYSLILLDFNLEGNQDRSNFDGIDLALMVDLIAKRNSLPTPWLVAFTAAMDDLLACFFNLQTAAPLMGAVSKRVVSECSQQLDSLFAALTMGDPSQFHGKTVSAPAFSMKVNCDDKADHALGRLSRTGRNTGELGSTDLAKDISEALFRSYRVLNFSALAPGYSGSEVLSVVARRSLTMGSRTFVIKICKQNGEAAEKLEKEILNYFKHAVNIKEHVPLLVGPFRLKGYSFIAYEFISVDGKGVTTFADYLIEAVNDSRITPEWFEENFSDLHAEFIFNRILKTWHETLAGADRRQDARYFYGQDSFQKFLKRVRRTIVKSYRDLEEPLLADDEMLELDLGLGPEPLSLSNPLLVVNQLLNKPEYNHPLGVGLVHGDLHSRNILRSLTMPVGDPGEWKLIDFANMYENAQLAQDATRLECDIKFQQIRSTLRPRFALEVELAKRMDALLSNRLAEVLNLQYWTQEWGNLPPSYKRIETQIIAMRKRTVSRLREGGTSEKYSPYIDYSVALLVQSLMFVRYAGNPIVTLHAWLAACLSATLITQYTKTQADEIAARDRYDGAHLPVGL